MRWLALNREQAAGIERHSGTTEAAVWQLTEPFCRAVDAGLTFRIGIGMRAGRV